MTRRLLLVGLDGLGPPELPYVQALLSKLPLGAGCRPVDSGILPVAAPLWSEIVGGSPWWKTGCPGFASPRHSLTSLHPCVEANGNGSGNARIYGNDNVVLVNVPFFRPAEGRLWLAPTAYPTAVPISPPELSSIEPLSHYRPNACASAVHARSTPSESIRRIIATQVNHLECTLVLMRKQEWKHVFLRLSAMEELLLAGGPLVLRPEAHRMSRELGSFFASFNELIEQIVREAGDALVCVLSPYGRVPCIARLNLNRLLVEGGFCTLARSVPAAGVHSERRQAALRLGAGAGTDDFGRELARPMISPVDEICAETTTAAAPTKGCVYINSQDRFADGIVPRAKTAALIEAVRTFLSSRLEKEFPGRVQLFCPVDAHERSPHLVVRVHGVEMHNQPVCTPVDREGAPEFTAGGVGFVWMSEQMTEGPPLSSLELHAAIKARLEQC